MINIYSSDTTDFNNNGLGVLTPSSCIIRERMNGEYSLEMTHIYDDKEKWKLIEEHNVIRANGQLFRIYKVVKTLTEVEIYATHIFYDLNNNFIEDTNIRNKSGTLAISQLLGATAYDTQFTATSNISTIASARIVRKNVVNAILGDESNTFINRWGGELQRDNFTFKMLSKMGADNGVKISYRKNLTGLTVTQDLTEMCTRIRPIGFDGIHLPELYVDSPYIDSYFQPIIREYKFENIKWSGSPNYQEPTEGGSNSGDIVFNTLEEAQSELRKTARECFETEKIDLPNIVCTVDFIELSKTDQFKKYAHLQTINLGDTVHVYFEKIGFTVEARCTEYVYDVLKDRYDSMTIGSFTNTFFDSIRNDVNTSVDENDKVIVDIKSELENAKNHLTEMIASGLGGYVVKTRDELLIMDTDNIDTAVKVWRWNKNGLAYSSTGYYGQYEIGITADGQIVGDRIVAGSIKAESIEVNLRQKIISSQNEEEVKALIKADLNGFKSEISKTFVTVEDVQVQIQEATQEAIKGATEGIVDNAVDKAMESVDSKLVNKFEEYTNSTLTPALSDAIQEAISQSDTNFLEHLKSYVTKEEHKSAIDQAIDHIKLSVSETYETKEESETRITNAIEELKIGAVNRALKTAESATKTFTNIDNEAWSPYYIHKDVSDQEVTISFNYSCKNFTYNTNGSFYFQAFFVKTDGSGHYQTAGDMSGIVGTKKGKIIFRTTFQNVRDNIKFRFRANYITGELIISNVMVEVGNKPTSWSPAREDLLDDIDGAIEASNKYTLEVLKNYTTKEDLKGELSVTSQNILSTVSSSYETKESVETKFQNLQIGGQNLIRDTGFTYSPTLWSGISTNHWNIDTVNKFENVNTAKISRSNLTADSWSELRSEAYPVKQGEKYVGSFYIKYSNVDMGSIFAIWGYDANGGNRQTLYTETFSGTNNEWTRLHKAVVIPAGVTQIRVCLSSRRNGTIWGGKAQLEKGSTLTDWSISSQDTDKKFDNYYTKKETYTIEEANSAIDQKAKSIISTVEETYETKENVQVSIGTALENLVIGGENLLGNSGYFINLDGWVLSKGTGQEGTMELVSDDKYGKVIKATKTNSASWWVLENKKIYPNGKFEIGQKYTISITMRTLNGSKVKYAFMDGDGTNIVYGGTATSTSNTFHRYSSTFTPTVTGNNPLLYITMESSNDTLYVANVKLEKGEKSTDWSISLYDYKTTVEINEDINGILKQNQDTLDRLSNLESDQVLTPSEKIILRRELDIVSTQKLAITEYYNTVNDTTYKNLLDNMNNEYNTLYNYLNPKLNNLSVNSNGDEIYIQNLFKNFYVAYEELLKSINLSLSGTVKSVKSEITQLSTSIDMAITNSTTALGKTETISKHFTFSDKGWVEIYAVTNGTEGKFKTRITDQKLAFLESGEEVAYLSNKELYITNATILDTMNIGTITIVPSKKDGSKCGIMFLWKG